VLAHGLLVLNGMLRLVGQHRPPFYFGAPGLALLGGGLMWGAWVINIFERTRQLATGYALVSVLLSIAGLILMSTGFMLHSMRGLLLDLLEDHKGRGE
jgi:hypothetical protein